ncbi:MAG TPA: hypothetical protein VGK99_09980 [Acidobacteriota bacterium]
MKSFAGLCEFEYQAYLRDILELLQRVEIKVTDLKHALRMFGALAVFFCAVTVTALAWQNPDSGRASDEPDFEDYPVNEIFHGKPARPVLATSWARQFRTRIREGVTKGWGVDHNSKERAGPNFAGHYSVITWGCGAGCLRMVIADLRTGRLYPPPLSQTKTGEGRITLPHAVVGPVRSEFYLGSGLFIMEDCPNDYDHRKRTCDEGYFVMDRDRWRLVHRVKGEALPDYQYFSLQSNCRDASVTLSPTITPGMTIKPNAGLYFIKGEAVRLEALDDAGPGCRSQGGSQRFYRWIIDGVAFAVGQRVIKITADRDIRAFAEYRPAVSGR